MHPELQACVESAPEAVYLVYGPVSLLVTRTTAVLRSHAEQRCQPAAFNVTKVRADDESAVAALSAARTLPMMADRRLVEITALESGNKTFFEALEAYLEAPSDTTTLLLSGAGFPPVKKGGSNWSVRITKRSAAAGRVLKFGAKDVSARAFVREQAASLGHTIARDAADLLIEMVGQDLGALAGELEKVSLYVLEGQPIETSHVTEACTLLAEADVWALTNALAVRNSELAYAALYRLMTEGENAHRLLGSIVWQMRTVLEVAAMVRARKPMAEIQRSFRMPQRVLRGIADRAREVPPAHQVMNALADANFELNHARVGSQRVLENLILRLTAA
ncbi:MAG: DNA polymerase III subunit delta [Myxococcota bacterium]